MNATHPTISSLMIAELAGLAHTEVLRDIRKALARLDIDPLKLTGRVFDNGERQNCYHLTRRECDLVVSGYGVVIVWPSSAADPSFN